MQPYLRNNSFSAPTFGSPIISRAFACGEYRFGFNGAEKDNEIAGSGNIYDLGFREYDARLGRMFSIDPRAPEYPWQSPYAYHRNSPIAMLDYLGGGDDDNTYTVQKGNTLGQIAKDNNTTVDNLLELNKSITDPNKILIGQKIKLVENLVRGTQGVAIRTAYEANNANTVRTQYNNTVSKLSPTDATGRTNAKIEARNNSTTINKTIAEAKRPISAEATRTSGTANKTNVGVNTGVKTYANVGRTMTVVAVGVSSYNIAKAENKPKQVAVEAGAWTGALAGGALGAKAGAAVGVWFGGAGAVPGAIIGGLIGSAGGAIAGSSLVEYLWD